MQSNVHKSIKLYHKNLIKKSPLDPIPDFASSHIDKFA